jgi:hypothetical protein
LDYASFWAIIFKVFFALNQKIFTLIFASLNIFHYLCIRTLTINQFIMETLQNPHLKQECKDFTRLPKKGLKVVGKINLPKPNKKEFEKKWSQVLNSSDEESFEEI